MFWGLSPALDLQGEYIALNNDNIEEMNILIIGGCDARHIIKTIAKSYKHKEKRINIHVIEGCAELIVRQVMLLYIATASSMNLGLQEKTRAFMEIYGNSLLRYSTSSHMVKASKDLIQFFTNLPLLEKHWPLISLERIKYRERDYVEMLLKFWKEGHSNKFDICYLWEQRQRRYLGVRYDVRMGVFDWDYNMRYREVGGKAVNLQEYKHFRQTGVAFTWLETEVSRPNYTFAAGVLVNGEKFIHRGYLGDVVTGPYVAYGLDCEDKDMMKVSNGTYHKRATDLTERNLMRMFYEIENRKAFDGKSVNGDTDHNLGMVTLAVQDAAMSQECIDPGTSGTIPDFINLSNIKVLFHSFSNLNVLVNNEINHETFHVMFVSNNLSKNIQPDIIRLMKKNSLILVEGKKFILDLKRENVEQFAKDAVDIAKDWNCELLKTVEPFNDSWARLRRSKVHADETNNA